jgi:hypothetical protein
LGVRWLLGINESGARAMLLEKWNVSGFLHRQAQ